MFYNQIFHNNNNKNKYNLDSKGLFGACFLKLFVRTFFLNQRNGSCF